MSNKAKTVVKNSPAGARGLTPKLRFPEFLDAELWDEKLLADLCKMQAGKFVPAAAILVEKIDDSYPCYGGNGLRGYTKTYTHEGKFPLIGRQGALCGNVNIGLNRFHATEHAVVATPNAGISVDWLSYELELLNLNRFATGQAQPGLSVDVLERVECAAPRDEREQQKIADCLSSIDDLIFAEAKKLDALKTHKKGLMQSLFPADGDTVPKLRFPEFRDAGAWNEKILSDFATIVRGGSPRPIDEYLTNDTDGLNWLKIGDIDKESKFVTSTKEKVIFAALSKTREVNPGDLILSNSMSFGRPYILKIKTCIHDGWIAVSQIKDDVSRDYLYYLMMTTACQDYFSNNAAGSGVQNLNADIIKLLPIAYPTKEEQQKVADCLSSVDEEISTVVKNLDMIKLHKEGLMQQLFPALDEVFQ